MAADNPLISIIVPAWNSERRVRTLLEALAGQTVNPARHQVLVVDNGSVDATSAVAASFPFVEVLSEQQPGSYRARNRALAQARGEYLLFTDADCVPADDWLEQAIARITRHPEIGIHAGRVRLFREPGAKLFSTRYEELVAFNQEGNVASGYCVTANMLCRAADLRAIGGFNDTLMSGGDVDCSRRMQAAGHRLAYAAEMVVGHPTRASFSALNDKRRRIIGGRWHLENWGRASAVKAAQQVFREGYYEARWIAGSSMEWWAKPGAIAISATLMLSAQAELLRLRAGRPPHRS